MKTLKVNLENCYGIRKLSYDFDFSDNNTYAIYAQNGSMKTSFAKTFIDFMEGRDTVDRIFKDRKTKREITDDTGKELDPKTIFVIKPIDNDFKSDKTSFLLANKQLRQEFEETYKVVENAKEPLLASLKKSSGLTKGIEEEISDTFYHAEGKFLDTVSRVLEDVKDPKEPLLNTIKYKTIFNPKVEKVAQALDFQEKLNSYVVKYDELLGKSRFFKKGIFNHYNAKTIADSLAKNGFFEASHTVSLMSGDESVEIKDKKALEKVIEDERSKILTDAELVKSFDEMEKLLDGTTETRAFRTLISENKEIIPELKSMNGLRQKIWIDYIKVDRDAYLNLHDKYTQAKKDLEVIRKKATEETTRWSSVVNEFNQRFNVPFVVEVGNKPDVILNNDVPAISFSFKDDDGSITPVSDEKELIDVLSQGERKALYILNIIFEIEGRKDQNIETIIVIDDIADSFDYKNKYAIIEYLKDIAEDSNFHQIILTHNFDFFRTVENRFAKRKKCLFSNRHSGSVELEEAEYIRRPFQFFMENLGDEFRCLAVVPFVRNIIEYTRGMEDDDFQALTSALHIKSDSDSITIGKFEGILKRTITDNKYTIALKNKDTVLHELFVKKSNDLIKTGTNMLLENKIILSVGIRLTAEKFMIGRIKDSSIIDKITHDQTYELFKIFSAEFPAEIKSINALKKVNLITPQNIHLNSFMYEPILDMSDHELKDLFQEVSAL